MTTPQLIASAITWTAAIAAVLAAALSWRAQQQGHNTLTAIRSERRTFSIPGGGEITVTAPMSDAEYAEFKTRWQATRDGQACPAYRVPKSAEDSGLCVRCGMSDYKHQEQP